MAMKSTLPICLALFVSTLAWSPGAASADKSRKSSRGSDVVGAWFCPLEGAGEAVPTEALVVFHSGGTLTANDTNDFFGLSSRPELAGTTLNSPNQGIWRRSGSRGVEVNFFGFMFGGDAAGADQGLLANTFRLCCDTGIRKDRLVGNCDLDSWAGVDTNGDAILESQNPATAAPTVSLEDLVGFDCSRLPLVRKND